MGTKEVKRRAIRRAIEDAFAVAIGKEAVEEPQAQELRRFSKE
jgi:hypothetical protein